MADAGVTVVGDVDCTASDTVEVSVDLSPDVLMLSVDSWSVVLNMLLSVCVPSDSHCVYCEG